MTAVEKITAALDEAEELIRWATPLPWESQEVFGDSVDLVTADQYTALVTQGGAQEDGGDVYGALDRTDADLIVSVVNRERAQIQHARDVLALAEHMLETSTGETRWADALIASLLAVWCPS